jgi:hypothetical protein
VPRTIAGIVQAVHPAFGVEAFLREALDGYEALALMPRSRSRTRATWGKAWSRFYSCRTRCG